MSSDDLPAEVQKLIDEHSKSELLDMPEAVNMTTRDNMEKIATEIVRVRGTTADQVPEGERESEPAPAPAVAKSSPPPAKKKTSGAKEVVFECSDPNRGFKVVAGKVKRRIQFKPHFREDLGEWVGRYITSDKVEAQALIDHGYKGPQPVQKTVEVDITGL